MYRSPSVVDIRRLELEWETRNSYRILIEKCFRKGRLEIRGGGGNRPAEVLQKLVVGVVGPFRYFSVSVFIVNSVFPSFMPSIFCFPSFIHTCSIKPLVPRQSQLQRFNPLTHEVLTTE